MNYTANSTYQTNLNLLLSSLATTFADTNTIPPYGYRNITVGSNPNTVYGSLHCRENIAPAICAVCVQIATERVMQDSGCPNKKTAILFYNGCILRYSDENYFSILNEEPSVVLVFVDNSIANQVGYIDLVTGLLDGLAIEAVTNTSISPSLYATGSATYNTSNKVYAMVQCTPDLALTLCSKCLRSALGKLPSGAQGARVLFPSCTLRFEYNPFYGNYMYTTRAPPPILQASPPPTLQPPSNTTYSKGKDSSKIVVMIAIPLVAVPDTNPDIQNAESLLFDFFNDINAATDNFSEDNKLGEGGFGPVYKGILSNGEEVAVKRLSKNSSQGDQEFKNEEKLLVYELMKASLDHFIFDTMKRMHLDWEKRYKIIGGIAKGLVCLHEDSRLRIIHRDLKASNILLAEDMIPKISDFGMARLFKVDQSQANTSSVAGTIIVDRPTMSTVIIMLSSNSMTFPLPTQPANFVPGQAVEKETWKDNEASVSELDPR
ncbi:cysteine-rich receptor-like protein kinase 10 [Papaver somniferum]|uniref:cysteine-rich receptor-like protein kinase 10 n=1 Tax=Papaver somniferum TaxID=3469 RepID=UPI000E6F46A1|nr:cysteine-rich receptor-like protein kinase 10 [Papaver somniferum]